MSLHFLCSLPTPSLSWDTSFVRMFVCWIILPLWSVHRKAGALFNTCKYESSLPSSPTLLSNRPSD